MAGRDVGGWWVVSSGGGGCEADLEVGRGDPLVALQERPGGEVARPEGVVAGVARG